MRYPAKLVEGRFTRRYKRFFADVEIGRGAAREVVTAHCANSGSMKTCVVPGGKVWLLPSDNPKRSLRWTWELAEIDGQLVCVNTARGNQLVAEALAQGGIPELAGYPSTRREVPAGDSRIDFLLERADQRCYVEVKTATMDGGDGVVAFPDAVTERGTRHIGELAAQKKAGHRAVLLFCTARTGAQRVRPADEIDPAYGEALRRAVAGGVEVLAYACKISPTGVALDGRIDVATR